MNSAELSAATRYIAEEQFGVRLRAGQRKELEEHQATAAELRARGLVTPDDPVT